MNEEQVLKLQLDPPILSMNLPENPGVYFFQDASGAVLYVGKAKNLKKRVLSYFRASGDLSSKTARMLKAAATLDYILTTTDKEAFILESNLIKKHLPRYNIILRDDKRYPSLRLDPREPYPGISVVRKVKKDGAYYFGPFSSSNAMRSTLKRIERIFPLRKCKGVHLPKRSRSCLNFQLGFCLGPCTHPVAAGTYQELVEQVRLFLQGRNRELLTALKIKMETAAEARNFEEAAGLRDQILAIEKTVEKQHVVSNKMDDLDVVGLARGTGSSLVAILFIREGYLSGSCHYPVKDEGGEPGEIIEAFLTHYYSRAAFIPSEVLISDPLEEPEALAEWLTDQKTKKVVILHPQRGQQAALIKMAKANAENQLQARQSLQMDELLKKVQTALQLRKLPRRIEAIDISNLSGELAVGAIVAYRDGRPAKEDFRNYKIQQVTGIDDYGMMSELVRRRLAKGGLPDLFLVDGGKGHLMVVQKLLGARPNADGPELAAIAKEREGEAGDKIFIPGRKNPLNLKPGDPELHFLMTIRDQVHRRSVGFLRQLKKGKMSASILDFIPGIGPKRKTALFRHFGDIKAISGANLDDFLKIPGLNKELALNIFDFFKNLRDND